MNEIEQFYLSKSKKHLSTSKGSSIAKDKDKEKHVPSIKKQQQDASRREAAAAKRMQELMRQFGTILRLVKSSWPFFYIYIYIYIYFCLDIAYDTHTYVCMYVYLCAGVWINLFTISFWDQA